MNEAKAPQYIDFLMSICTCGPESNPEPLSNVQDMVTNVLLDMDVNAAIGGYGTHTHTNIHTHTHKHTHINC